MKKKTAKRVLKDTISLLIEYLQDLSHISNQPHTQFAYGEKLAYTEILELLSEWEKAEKNGLDFDIEKRFPL